ncbi:MAG: dTDP-4-amino-4,6-dideoxygalactose transaminase [Cyanobacteria bacterium]|nr:dTDP-4-amino-4,6-dideoxygalactose transaminase [Cyanobacteriota bacterium]
MADALSALKLSGDGAFTKQCESFFQRHFGFHKAVMTPSCTDALEMSALLLNLQPGDEVILPSYTFVSTANAFLLHGAKLVFADSLVDSPNIDPAHVETLITPNTRAIVLVHYAGFACDIPAFERLAQKHQLILIEDAAHSVDATFLGKPLGSFGQMSTFSFHETKNITCGEGGMLILNDPSLVERAEIIREKGTNRSAFFRGEVDKYNWRDKGSSFLAPDYVAAFLWGQLEALAPIQSKRITIWDQYYQALKPLAEQGKFKLPTLSEEIGHNAHLFYLVTGSLAERTALMVFLKEKGIHTTFHYVPLHQSPCAQQMGFAASQQHFPHAERYADCLLRLPLHLYLNDSDISRVIEGVHTFYGQH